MIDLLFKFKMGHFILRRATKIKQRHIECYLFFFHWPLRILLNLQTIGRCVIESVLSFLNRVNWKNICFEWVQIKFLVWLFFFFINRHVWKIETNRPGMSKYESWKWKYFDLFWKFTYKMLCTCFISSKCWWRGNACYSSPTLNNIFLPFRIKLTPMVLFHTARLVFQLIHIFQLKKERKLSRAKAII